MVWLIDVVAVLPTAWEPPVVIDASPLLLLVAAPKLALMTRLPRLPLPPARPRPAVKMHGPDEMTWQLSARLREPLPMARLPPLTARATPRFRTPAFGSNSTNPEPPIVLLSAWAM